MTVLTMRRIRDHFVVTGPDIEPVTFKTRAEARDWCLTHYQGSPVREIISPGQRACIAVRQQCGKIAFWPQAA